MFSMRPNTGTLSFSNIVTALVASSSDTELGAVLAQRQRQVHRDGGLANASLVGGDGDDVAHSLDDLWPPADAGGAHRCVHRHLGVFDARQSEEQLLGLLLHLLP